MKSPIWYILSKRKIKTTEAAFSKTDNKERREKHLFFSLLCFENTVPMERKNGFYLEQQDFSLRGAIVLMTRGIIIPLLLYY